MYEGVCVEGTFGAHALAYDGAGNMTSVSGTLLPNWTLVYDDASRLTSITYPWGEGTSADEYLYNALGQAMEYQPNGYARQAWVYDGDRLLEVRYARTGSIKARYSHEGGSYFTPWQVLSSGSYTRFPLYDGVGTVRHVVDETGTIEHSDPMDAFGVPATPGYGGEPVQNIQRYGGAWGYLTSYNTGLRKLGARFYWPELGRFVQQDPIGDGMNWYPYAGNNPVVWVDPEGLLPLFLGVEGDFVPAHIGAGLEASLGFVGDTDSVWELGVYGTAGPAIGGNIGVAVTGGFAVRGIEGFASNVDINAGPVSVVGSTDAEDWNGAAVGYGLGGGAHVSITKTWTYTLGDARDDLSALYQDIRDIVWFHAQGRCE